MEFAAVSGPREYDWTKKQTFLLDVIECGEALNLNYDNKNGIEFLHDPNMGDSAKAGQVTKKFKITPTPDGKGNSFR